MLVAGVGAADHRVVAAEQRRCDRVKPCLFVLFDPVLRLRNNYLVDIAALPLFDLTVGQDNKFLFAEAFRPVLESATDAGVYHMVQGRGHLDVLSATETLQITIRHLEAGSL